MLGNTANSNNLCVKIKKWKILAATRLKKEHRTKTKRPLYYNQLKVLINLCIIIYIL